MATTIEKDNSQYTIITCAIANGELSDIIWLTDARTVYIVSNKALTYKLPNWDTSSDVPIVTTTEDIDIPASENLFAPTATTAGVIPATSMPPFIALSHNSGSGTAAVAVYILKHFT